jgi:ATP-binding cassette subfamily B protein
MKALRSVGRAEAFRAVLGFTFAHWRRQVGRVSLIVGAVLFSTGADVLLPVYAGRLVDAVASGGDRAAALDAALVAFFVILALGIVTVGMRHVSFVTIVNFTLRMMTDVAAEAFHRVQHFSTEWHANSFAGSTVRKISRGMWALDLLNDTILAGC